MWPSLLIKMKYDFHPWNKCTSSCFWTLAAWISCSIFYFYFLPSERNFPAVRVTTWAGRAGTQLLFHGAKCFSARRHPWCAAAARGVRRERSAHRPVDVLDPTESQEGVFVPRHPLLFCKRGHWFCGGDVSQLEMDGGGQITSSRPQNYASIVVNLGLCWAGVERLHLPWAARCL